MTDTPEERTPGAEETRSPPDAEAGAAPARRGKTAALWAAVVLLGFFAGVQGGGVLLRDRVEGRRAVAVAPPPGTGLEAAAPSAPASGGRFGPEVREVVIASAPPPPAEPGPASPSEPPPASPVVAPAPPAAPEVPPAVEPAPPAPPPPAPTVKVTASPAAPAPSRPGTHALQMGVFRSQKYRREMEQRLDSLAVPHYRLEGTTGGASFRLAAPVTDDAARGRARAALDAAGYTYRETPEGIEARFFVEEEAQHALDLLSRAGLKGGYMRVEGETPLWTVLAGPFTEEDARQARQRLSREGLESYLRKRP